VTEASCWAETMISRSRSCGLSSCWHTGPLRQSLSLVLGGPPRLYRLISGPPEPAPSIAHTPQNLLTDVWPLDPNLLTATDGAGCNRTHASSGIRLDWVSWHRTPDRGDIRTLHSPYAHCAPPSHWIHAAIASNENSRLKKKKESTAVFSKSYWRSAING
jgi:hypothetical protein